MYWIYNVLILLLAPIWAPWMWWRAHKRKEKPNWKERMGSIEIPPRKVGKRVWFHAVSVGEVVASMPILRAVRQELPDHEIVLSVTTSSGHQTARERATELFDHLIYFPIDVARFQLSAMQAVRPSVVVVMETELWFNFLWAAKVFDAQTLLVNGRISDRSYPRSKKILFFYRALLKYMDRCLMQTQTDADRIKELGAQNVEVFGNSKFDQAVEGIDADPVAWRQLLGLDSNKLTLVIGSTRGEAEEAFVIQAVKSVGLEKLQVIHAPRHLETVEGLANQVRAAFGSVALRSKSETGPYLILDTYGELSQVYSVADFVIVGGGFSNLGGQNIIQPLAHGKPVIHGHHMQNFRDVADAARHANATIECSTPEELTRALHQLIESPELRAQMSERARDLVKGSMGASERYGKAIAYAATRSS